MKKHRFLSLLLFLGLVASLTVPGIMAQSVLAADGGTDQEEESMVTNKYVTYNEEDGTYTITLEAYATGEKVITETSEEKPVDIVLVLDQSGSMDYSFGYTYSSHWATSNQELYNQRHNQVRGGSVYYQLSDGSYVAVNVDRTRLYETSYHQCPGNWVNHDDDGEDNSYWEYKDSLYEQLKDGSYVPVSVTRQYVDITWGGIVWDYTYTFSDGITVTSNGNNTRPDFEGRTLYYGIHTERGYTYSYYYVNADGERMEICTSEGRDGVPEETFYQRVASEESRLSALKTAVTNFVGTVKAKAAGEDGVLGNDDDVDHHIAVVGFASESGLDDNTELLSVNGYNSGSVGIAYEDIDSADYRNVLQDMSTQDGQNMVDKAIEALDANGATRADLGMEMAKEVFNKNPVPEGEERVRVVVFFTDGVPTTSSAFDVSVANNAIGDSNIIKNSGAVVYAVGIFDGADATSEGSIYSNDEVQKANWFMQNVSSNNGTVQTPSYYLSASNTANLSSIFQQIAGQIETGGSSTTLDSNAVIRDIIAPSFTLPADTSPSDITLETHKYTGENSWSKNDNVEGITASIEGNTVSVTGFDFSENWCGKNTENNVTTYHGNKLVIKFDVVPKDNFLGGNDVPTNTSAGVYADDKSITPMFTFPEPKANVKIKGLTVTAPDKNVYLLGDLTAEQIKSGATADCGGAHLNLAAPYNNYGLADWQSKYVNISVTYTDENGAQVMNIDDLDEDSIYSVSVIIKPKAAAVTEVGPANETTGQSGSAKGDINVFTPILTFADSQAWYGDTAPTNFDDNQSGETVWIHDQTESTAQGITMVGDEPELELGYSADTAMIMKDKINTKDDIAVNVTVQIDNTDVTQKTAFIHTDCAGQECGTPKNGKFWLHINTCQLTISKKGGAVGEPYAFTVNKDGESYTSLTIVGNDSVTLKELPVGTYSIKEDRDWSWRYTPEYDKEIVTLNEENAEDFIICTNTDREDPWLNDYSPVVKNVYGEEQTVVNE